MNLFALSEDFIWEGDEIARKITFLPASEGIIFFPSVVLQNKDH